MIFHSVFAVIIVFCIICFCTETLDLSGQKYRGNPPPEVYEILEIFFTILFSVEIFIRMIVATAWCKSEKTTPFFRDILVWFDIVSVLPLPLKVLTKNRPNLSWTEPYIKTLNVARVLRIFKVTRSFTGAKVLFQTMKAAAKPLLVSFVLLGSFSFIVAMLLFLVEPCYSTDCQFTDPLNAGYFLVVTLTTVGYGDQIPVTPAGKLVALGVAFMGSFYMAMPLAIIGAKFEEAYAAREFEDLGDGNSDAVARRIRLEGAPIAEKRDRVLRVAMKAFETVTAALGGKNSEIPRHMSGFESIGMQLASDMQACFEISLSSHLAAGQNVAKNKVVPVSDGKSQNEERPLVQRQSSRKNTSRAIQKEINKGMVDIHVAKMSGKCRDKVWLILNDPTSGKCANMVNWFQLSIVFLSIIVVFLEATPELNKYGESSRLCKQVVAYHCAQVETQRENGVADAMSMNPGCYKYFGEGSPSGNFSSYKGCFVKDTAKIEEQCSFGAPEFTRLGVTCEEPVGANATLNYPVEWREPFSTTWAEDNNLSPVCSRIQCTKNSAPDLTTEFMAVEIVFVTIFLVDIVLRFFVRRSMRKFCCSLSNAIDMAAAFTALVEIIWIPITFGDFAYEVWGNGPLFDPATFRFLRVLVSIRFISMQRHTAGLQVIHMTLKKVWRKMIIPSVFFVLFTVLFGALIFTTERETSTIAHHVGISLARVMANPCHRSKRMKNVRSAKKESTTFLMAPAIFCF